MSAVLDDIRVGARLFRRNPGYAATVVATLAVGIAACTVVFSVVNAFLYRPYQHYPNASRLVFLLEQNRHLGTVGPVSAADMNAWREASRSFEQMGGIRPATLTLVGGCCEPEAVFSGQVTPGFLSLLGARTAAGRLLVESDYGPAASSVVLTHAIWVRRFASAPSVVGKVVSLDGRPATVVGVLGEEFTVKGLLGGDTEIFTPLPMSIASDPSSRALFVVGRLRPGVGTSAARTEMKAIAARTVRTDGPGGTSRRADVYVWNPTEFDLQGDAGFIVVLFVGMAFVLAIIVANVGNLLFTRAAARTKEVATRLAIGAGRWHVVRLVMTEALLLGLVGSAAAALLAYWACRGLSWRLAGTNIAFADFTPDARVFAFTVTVSLATALVASLAPAMRLAWSPVLGSLREASCGVFALSPGRLRRLLVAAEVSLALVLLAGTGLVLKGVLNLRQNDPGFRSANLATALTTLSAGRYADDASKLTFSDQLLARLQARAEFRSVALSSFMPLAGNELPVEACAIEGQAGASPAGTPPSAGVISASPGYFATLAVPLLSGRAFGSADGPGTLPVAIINERAARRWFEASNPVGARIQVAGAWRTIVGVVGDVRNFHLNVAPAPTVYVPLSQRPSARLAILGRTNTAAAESAAAALKTEVRALDANQPVRGVRSMDEIIDRSMGGFEMTTMVVAVLGVVALALAALGIYGSVAFSVARRTREIGIRIALGAAPAQVLQHVLGDGLRLALIGGVPGLLLAVALGRLLASKLHRVNAVDPAILGSAIGLLVAMVLVASLVPARRAARVQPLIATRTE